MSSDSTTTTNSSGVFSGSGVCNSINENLKGVLSGKEVYNFKSLLHDSHSHLLFTAVSSLHHHRIGESFDEGAVNFLEASLLISASGEGQEYLSFLRLDVDVGKEGKVLASDALI